jgi:anti-sigma factor RsiW
MSCSPFDLRDYFFQELSDPHRQRQVEAHVKTCAPCREELDRLRITGAALRSLAEEEIPQRIAFVSDQIFEPSPWRRWLAAFWNSGARLGFASAAMLSASLVVFAFRPAPAPVLSVIRPAVTAPAPVTVTQASAVSEAEVQRRIQAAVNQAVDLKTKDLMKRIDSERVGMLIAVGELEQLQKRMQYKISATNYGPPKQSLVEEPIK